MRILIAVPAFDHVEVEVFKAIYNLDKCGHDVAFDFVRGYDCAVARNEIGRLAQEGGFDYVLMVDSDTLIPPNTLKLMLDPPEDIVLGVCPRKNTKNGKTAIIKLGSPGYVNSYHYSDLPAERTQVKGGGFACALVRTSVFTRLDYPYFQYVTNQNGTTLSEDYYFCKNANLMNIPVYVEPRVRCGHLARYYQFE